MPMRSRAFARPQPDNASSAASTLGSGSGYGAMIRRSSAITSAFASKLPMRTPASAQALDKVRKTARLS